MSRMPLSVLGMISAVGVGHGAFDARPMRSGIDEPAPSLSESETVHRKAMKTGTGRCQGLNCGRRISMNKDFCRACAIAEGVQQ